ncbi:MAG TPA: MerR family transcriptional regulator [Gaiellales bacterium]|jgi:MerR family transcriptional regulator/heat shock protein HspR
MGSDETPKYAISVAAEFVGMHPQTLRLYETRRLVVPRRSAGGRRLYSDADLARLESVKALTTALGLNHSGVEHVLLLEQTLTRLQQRVSELEGELATLRRAHSRAVADRDRAVRHEVVLWQPPSQALAPRR